MFQMNKTRLEWSGLFGCCKEKQTDLTAFYGAISIFFVIFVGFYLYAFLIGMKHNASEHLDAHDIRNDETTTVGNSKPKKLRINGDDSSDDEPLLTDTAQIHRDLVNLTD
jgi:hypothetical protein